MWQRFLKGLPIEPDTLPRPVAQPGECDFIICGVPRSGTTLVAGMLFQPPHVVTVMEPWDGMRLVPADLFASLRREIRETGQLRRGKLDVAALREQRKVKWQAEGATPAEVKVNGDFSLGVKWPAFWRYVELLPDTKFVVCVRHPAEVVQSFEQQGERLAQGYMYDTRFNLRMHAELRAATDDDAERRILLYKYISDRLIPHLERPNVHVVRYESWLEDPDTTLRALCEFLGLPKLQPTVSLRSAKAKRNVDATTKRLLRKHLGNSYLGYDLATTEQSV